MNWPRYVNPALIAVFSSPSTFVSGVGGSSSSATIAVARSFKAFSENFAAGRVRNMRPKRPSNCGEDGTSSNPRTRPCTRGGTPAMIFTSRGVKLRYWDFSLVRRATSLQSYSAGSKESGVFLSCQIGPYQRDRRTTDCEEPVVELPPGRPAATRRGPVVAQLADHQLALGVVEIRRIERAARRLLACIGGVLERLLAEHPLGLGQRQAAGVQPE